MESAHDLNEFIPEVKPADEIKELISKHWIGEDASADDELDADEKPASSGKLDLSVPDDDDIPMDGKKSEEDDDLDELLKD